MVDVSIVIVCMNRPENLTPCLDSIREYTKVSYETFVVAYLFTLENLSWLRENYPWVTIVESNEIRGFSENNNLALRLAKGKYCFVVNDDTWMEMSVVDALVADLENLSPNAAAVQPAAFFPDGRRQMCGRVSWTPWFYLKSYFHLTDETKPSRWTWQDGLFKTGSLNGACFLIKTDIFRQVGWFDETYTFTPEDLALGFLLVNEGYDVYADASVKITHVANATASTFTPILKPVRVRGSLILYSSLHHLSSPQGTEHVNRITYFFMALSIFAFESLRGLKYLFLRGAGARLMAATARNVRHTVFTRKSPKEVFLYYYESRRYE